MDPHNSGNGTEAHEKGNPERSKQHSKPPLQQHGMMHVWFNETWHGKVHKQYYKLSGAQYATSCILTEHHNNYLVLSRLSTQQN